MLYIKFLDSFNLTKSGNLCVNTVEIAACSELALPGIIIVSCHIIVCMISGNNHEWTKNNFLVTCVLNCLDYIFTGSLFRLPLYGSDKDIVITKLIHLCRHLAVTYFCRMGSTVSHEYKCSTVLLSSIQ